MTDQAADIAQFAVRVLVVLIPLLTSAAQLVLTDYTAPAFSLPVWMSNHAGFPLFLLPQRISGSVHSTQRPFFIVPTADRLPALHPNPATSTEPV